MHVPDGLLTAPTALATTGLALAAVAVAVRRARREPTERVAPLGGLLAAFVFVVQYVSLPLPVGTNVHAGGTVLAAVLVGPWTAVLIGAAVLVMQVLVLGHGGVTGAGAGMIVMHVVPALVGYGCAWLTVRRSGGRGVAVAAGAGAGVGVLAGAAAFALVYLVGGAVPLPAGEVAGVVVVAHLPVAAVEAVLTALVVAAVLRTRPDLVRLAAGARPSAAPAPEVSP